MTNSVATRRKYANSTIGKLKHENEKLRTALREIEKVSRPYVERAVNEIAKEALGDE